LPKGAAAAYEDIVVHGVEVDHTDGIIIKTLAPTAKFARTPNPQNDGKVITRNHTVVIEVGSRVVRVPRT